MRAFGWAPMFHMKHSIWRPTALGHPSLAALLANLPVVGKSSLLDTFETIHILLWTPWWMYRIGVSASSDARKSPEGGLAHLIK